MNVPWPGLLEYQDAMQLSHRTLRDPELAACTLPDRTPFDLPLPVAGSVTNVYRLRHPDGREWAVRVFLRPSLARLRRYEALAAYLRTIAPPACLVSFAWQPEGILIGARAYPLVKMPWVQGEQINRHVERRINESAELLRLAREWAALAGTLEAARIVHGDLQHGNILAEAATGALRLIDYDAVSVPGLVLPPPETQVLEVGHPAFQHPARGPATAVPGVDRFSELVIYVALQALAQVPELWYRLDNGDNLLFAPEDFRDPERSRAFLLLRQTFRTEPGLRALVEALAAACRQPLALIPPLSRFVGSAA